MTDATQAGADRPRTVLVTGGGRGIGLGVVQQFLSEGCRVAVIEKDLECADPGFADLVAQDHRLWAMSGDLNSPADREAFVSGAQERFGRIDVLVNNAGVAPRVRRDLLEVDEESWDFVLGTNLKANFFLTQQVARVMTDQDIVDGVRGYIVNYGSLNSYVIATDRVEYAVSKAGVAMLTRTFARRLAPDRVYVYEVRPGVIDTPMTQVVHEKYTRMIEKEDAFPIARWGQPSDVALAISGLVGGAFLYSTGEVINVDGGFHLRKL